MTTVDDSLAAPAPVPAFLRGRRGRAFVHWAAEAGESGRLRRLIYAVAAIGGILSAGTLCTLFIVVLPDGSSVQRTHDFLNSWKVPMMAAVVPAALAFGVAVWALGSIAATLWQADTSKGHALSFIAFTSDLISLTLFVVEVAFWAALLVLIGHEGTSPEFLHGIWILIFHSAYIYGPLWLPAIVATNMISRRSNLFPRWLELIGWWAAFWTFIPIVGIFFLSGPFNLENGLLGAVAQVIGPAAWVFAFPAWTMAKWAPAYFRHHADNHLGVTET